MPYDYVEIGPTPSNEPCQQVGTANYDPIMARKECYAFKNQLIRQFGHHEGTSIIVKSQPHDFGSYLEVVVKFDDSVNGAAEYAFEVENECPEQWDDLAKEYLINPFNG